MTPISVAVPCVTGHGRVLDELVVDGARLVAVEHAAGLAIASHRHDTAKLAILLDGGATERIGADLVEHAQLELVARPRLCAHENQYHAEGARSIVVELDELAGVPDLTGLARPLDPVAARLHGRRIAAAFGAPRGDRARLARAALREAIAALDAAPPPRTPAWLERARELLFAQIARPPGLADLADRVGVHPVHLAQAFRKRWRTTPLGFVRAHRVFRAVELIARGAPLAGIAAEVGFADQSHMTRAIHRARRAPPGLLRRRMSVRP